MLTRVGVHLHSRRPYQRSLEPVPWLERRADGVLSSAIRCRCGGHRFVERRVEGFTYRIDPFDTRILKFLPQLAVDRAETFAEGGKRSRRIAGDQPVQVVEHVQQLGHEAGLRTISKLGALPAAALSIIIELGGEPQVPVLELGEVPFQLGVSATTEAGLGFFRSGGRYGTHISGSDIATLSARAGFTRRFGHSSGGIDWRVLALDLISNIGLSGHLRTLTL